MAVEFWPLLYDFSVTAFSEKPMLFLVPNLRKGNSNLRGGRHFLYGLFSSLPFVNRPPTAIAFCLLFPLTQTAVQELLYLVFPRRLASIFL